MRHDLVTKLVQVVEAVQQILFAILACKCAFLVCNNAENPPRLSSYAPRFYEEISPERVYLNKNISAITFESCEMFPRVHAKYPVEQDVAFKGLIIL